MTWLWNILGFVHEVWAFRHEPEHFRRLADMYWGLLLFLAFSVVISASVYGALKFLETTRGNGEDALAPSGGGLLLLNKRDLQATLDGFAARSAAYEAFKTNPPTIVDPSR